MAERYQPGEIFARFLEDLPRIMMMQQQMELSERRLDIADKNAMADATYRADALAQSKETAKNTELNNLLSQATSHAQRAIVYKQAGKYELAAHETKEGERIADENALASEVYALAPEESLVKLAEYFSVAQNPADPLYQTMLKYRDEQIDKKYTDYEEIRSSGKYGATYRALEERLKAQIASGAEQKDIELTEAEMDKTYGAFSSAQSERYKAGTSVGLPEVDDYNDEVADYILKGTVVDVTSEAERYKDIPGYGILPEEELEKLNQRGLPTDRPAKVSDIKKISQSDMFSNVKGKTTKQRAQIIGKILGRDVSEEESEKLIIEIGKATLIGRGKEFVSGAAAAIAETPKYPIRTGQYAVD